MTLHTSLRVLAANEVLAVSGGEDEIVVVGTRSTDTYYLDMFDSMRFSFDYSAVSYGSLDGGGGGGTITSSEGEWNPDGDDDGDGIPNSQEEIVVVAPLSPPVDLSGDYHARYNYEIGAWMIWEDDIIWDDFEGYFIPGTPENHNFVTQASNWGIDLGIDTPQGGGTVGGNVEGGGVEYWIRVVPPFGY